MLFKALLQIFKGAVVQAPSKPNLVLCVLIKRQRKAVGKEKLSDREEKD